jgi:putative sigma-54 modulation protein
MYRLAVIELCFVAMINSAASFLQLSTSVPKRGRVSSFLMLSAKVNVIARGMDLTDALRARCESKIGKVLDKLSYTGVQSAGIVLRVNKFPVEEKHAHTTKKDSQIAECTVVLKGGQVIHTSEKTEDMYASIDLLSHALAKKMKRLKERVQSKRRNEKVGGNTSEDEEKDAGDFNEEELLVELNNEYKKYAVARAPVGPRDVDLDAVKRKVFKMPPISLEEAITSLEYIDHPFFVFRNKVRSRVVTSRLFYCAYTRTPDCHLSLKFLSSNTIRKQMKLTLFIVRKTEVSGTSCPIKTRKV